MIEEYLEKRQNLKRTFMLIDIRHKPSNDDVLMYKFLKYYNIPVTIIATKMDKLPKSKLPKAKELAIKTLELKENDTIILISNTTKEGRDLVLNELEDLLPETL